MGIRYLCQFCRKLSKELWRNVPPLRISKKRLPARGLGRPPPAASVRTDPRARIPIRRAGKREMPCVIGASWVFSTPFRPVPDRIRRARVNREPGFEISPPLKTPMRESREPGAFSSTLLWTATRTAGGRASKTRKKGCRPNLKGSRHSITLAGGSCISLPRCLAAIDRGWLSPRPPVQVRPQDNPQSRREALRRPDAAIWELPLQIPELCSSGRHNRTTGF